MSDDKIVPFTGGKGASKRDPKTTQVFECVCGSQSFYMLVGGDVQCRSCDEVKKQRWFDPSEKKDS